MPVAVPINYLAVVIAAVASIVLGFLWYGPLFGKPWMAMMGMTPEKMAAAKKKGMAKSYVGMLVTSLLTAFVMAHAMVFAMAYLKIDGLNAGLQGGFWNWLGFVAPVTMGSVLWEGKSMKLWVLNSGFWLVNLCMMGIIFAMMH